MKVKNYGRRGLALFLALVMCFSLLNLTAFAVDGDEQTADGDNDVVYVGVEDADTTEEPDEEPAEEPVVEEPVVDEPEETEVAESNNSLFPEGIKGIVLPGVTGREEREVDPDDPYAFETLATVNPERGYYDHIDIRYTGGNGTYTLEHYDASGKVLLWTANGRVTVRNVTSATYVEYGTGATKTATFTGNATQDGGEFETSKNLKVQSHQWISVNLNYDYSYTVTINGRTETYTGNRTSTVSLNTDNTVCDDRGGYIGADLVVTIKDIEKDIEEDVGDQVQKDYDQVAVNKVWKNAEDRAMSAPSGVGAVTVQLKQDGKVHGTPVTLSGTNNWAASWTIEKNAGETHTYAVEEINVPTGYTAKVNQNGNSFTITNTANLNPVPGLTVTKTADKAGPVALGEKITYTIKVENTGDVALKGIVVTDELSGAKIVAGTDYKVNTDGTATIAELAKGASVEVKAEYTVMESDLGGSIKNTATAKADDDTTDSDDETVSTEDKVEKLTVEKEASVDHNPAKLGDVITYTLTVKNEGNQTLTNATVTDTLKGIKFTNTKNVTYDVATGVFTIGSIAPGQTVTIEYTYKVTLDDTKAGEVKNAATTSTEDKAEVTTPVEKTYDFQIKKVDENNQPLEGASFALYTKDPNAGGFDPYRDLAKNIRGYVVIAVSGEKGIAEIKDLLAGTYYLKEVKAPDGYKLSDEVWTIVVGQKPDSETPTEGAQSSDFVNGVLTVVNYKIEEPTPTPTPDPTPDPTPTSELSITKKGEVQHIDANQHLGQKTYENGNVFDIVGVGDVITYTITVINTGDGDAKNVTVTDYFLGAGSITVGDLPENVTYAQNVFTIASIEAGMSVEITYTYTVQQADLTGYGEIVNYAAAGDAKSDWVTFVVGQPGLSVIKQVVSADDDYWTYGTNSVISYQVTVKNTGDFDLTNVTVEDALFPSVVQVGYVGTDGYKYLTTEEGALVLEKLEKGQTAIILYDYVVTEDDVKATDDEGNLLSKVVNNVTASAAYEGRNVSDSATTTTKLSKDLDPHLLVMKTTDFEGAAKAGDTINYTITVKNTGNVTVTNIIVKDKLPRTTLYKDGEPSTGKIDALAPGHSVTFTVSYLVTQADVEKGDNIKNVATAKGDGMTEEAKDEVETPVVKNEPHLSVYKRASQPADGKAFKVGETIAYTITVVNDGNVTLSGIVVTDPLTGLDKGIGKLAPNESTIVLTYYTVTEKDVIEGGVKNVATARIGGEDEYPSNEVETPTEEANPSMDVTKTVTSEIPEGQNGYRPGDTITFDIKVVNDGNLTLKDVIVTDGLEGAKIVEGEGYTVNENGTATIAELAPNASVVVKAEYVVTAADVTAGSVVNSAAASADDPSDNTKKVEDDAETPPQPTEPTPVPPTPSNPTTQSYTVTVNYYDQDTGAVIATRYYSGWLSSGTRYDVSAYDAIEIDGYSHVRTEGDPLKGTLDGNKVINVYYTANEIIEDEDPPLTDIPEEDPPLTDLPDEDPPLADIPDEDPPLVDLPDEDVPQAGTPSKPSKPGNSNTVTIEDEDVPLADIPKTGDESAVWFYLAVLSGASLLCLLFVELKKYRKN